MEILNPLELSLSVVLENPFHKSPEVQGQVDILKKWWVAIAGK